MRRERPERADEGVDDFAQVCLAWSAAPFGRRNAETETRLTGELGALEARMAERSAESESRIMAALNAKLAKQEARFTWRLIGVGAFVIAAITLIDRLWG